NIKVRADGTVKVLDFGLAKAIEPSTALANATQSPTITTPAMTQAGVILGTAAYMSPEQVRGRLVDKRSDIWSFGCVCYEALTGKRPFEGTDIAETLANVIKDEPNWSALRSRAPSFAVEMVRSCLEKDPRNRINSAAVLGHILKVGDSPTLERSRRSIRMPGVTGIALSAALAGLAAGAALMGTKDDRAPRPLSVSRFTINRSDGQLLSNTGRHVLAISPDGSRLVFSANGRLYLRGIADLEAFPIRGIENLNASEPFFSPDGEWVGFYTGDGIKKVQVSGGIP